jgi:hypothetical protein
MELKWYGDQVLAQAEAPFREAVEVAYTKTKEAFSDPIWAWDFSPSPRDVVLTGQLRDSQTLTFTGPLEAEIRWPVEYALHVFLGYTRKNGSTAPARNVPEEGLRRTNFAFTFAALYRGNP